MQQEKDRIQKESDRNKADHDELRHRLDQLLAHKDHYAAENEKKQQLIKSLHKELGEDDADFDDEDDDPLLHRIRREREKRVKE